MAIGALNILFKQLTKVVKSSLVPKIAQRDRHATHAHGSEVPAMQVISLDQAMNRSPALYGLPLEGPVKIITN